MAFEVKHDHPLGWGDKELKYMIGRGINPTVMYRLMGYNGKRPNASFLKRLEALGWNKDTA